jgi:hypothetical protein
MMTACLKHNLLAHGRKRLYGERLKNENGTFDKNDLLDQIRRDFDPKYYWT